jgi:hypothetical protein
MDFFMYFGLLGHTVPSLREKLSLLLVRTFLIFNFLVD